MTDRTRRIRDIRRRQLRARGSSSITFTKSEPYALCFYLYNMFENKSNSRIIENFDEGIKCFISCVQFQQTEKYFALCYGNRTIPTVSQVFTQPKKM